MASTRCRAEVTALENTELTRSSKRPPGVGPAARGVQLGVRRSRRKLNDLGERFDRSASRRGAGGLIALVEKATISASIGKTVFEKMYDTGRSADDIVAAEGWRRSATKAIAARACARSSWRSGRRCTDSQRQDRHVRVPRRPGDEENGGQGEPEARE
jgi:hypothetical protein